MPWVCLRNEFLTHTLYFLSLNVFPVVPFPAALCVPLWSDCTVETGRNNLHCRSTRRSTKRSWLTVIATKHVSARYFIIFTTIAFDNIFICHRSRIWVSVMSGGGIVAMNIQIRHSFRHWSSALIFFFYLLLFHRIRLDKTHRPHTPA